MPAVTPAELPYRDRRAREMGSVSTRTLRKRRASSACHDQWVAARRLIEQADATQQKCPRCLEAMRRARLARDLSPLDDYGVRSRRCSTPWPPATINVSTAAPPSGSGRSDSLRPADAVTCAPRFGPRPRKSRSWPSSSLEYGKSLAEANTPNRLIPAISSNWTSGKASNSTTRTAFGVDREIVWRYRQSLPG